MTFSFVKSRLRQTLYKAGDLLHGVNREIVPTLAELVRRFNALSLGDLGFVVVSATGSVTAEAFHFIDFNAAIAGPVTVTLSPGALGDMVKVKAPPNAGTHNVTVSGGLSTIDGAATFVMNTDNQSASFLFNGTQWRIF